MKALKNKLQEYIDGGWVVSQRHPKLPLTIYNYSQKTQFEKNWDEITLSCRGLVLDDDGNVVARPFKKFFNWEEILHTVSSEQLSMPFEVFEKMDGSLGVGFWYDGEFVIATRGSFTSDQAIKAKEMLKNYRIDLLNERGGERDYTLLFEIIYGNSVLETIEIELENGKIARFLPDTLVSTKRGKVLASDLIDTDEIIIYT